MALSRFLCFIILLLTTMFSLYAQVSSAPALIPWLGKQGLFGYCDTAGTIKILPCYTRAAPFAGRYAVAEQGGGYGIIRHRAGPVYYASQLRFSGNHLLFQGAVYEVDNNKVIKGISGVKGITSDNYLLQQKGGGQVIVDWEGRRVDKSALPPPATRDTAADTLPDVIAPPDWHTVLFPGVQLTGGKQTDHNPDWYLVKGIPHNNKPGQEVSGIFDSSTKKWILAPKYTHLSPLHAPGTEKNLWIYSLDHKKRVGVINLAGGVAITPDKYSFILPDGKVSVQEEGRATTFYINVRTGKEYRE